MLSRVNHTYGSPGHSVLPSTQIAGCSTLGTTGDPLLAARRLPVYLFAKVRTTIATQKIIQAVNAMPAMEILSGSIIGS